MFLALTLISGLFSAVFTILVPYVLGEAIDAIAPGNEKIYSFAEYIGILGTLYALGAVMQWAVPYFASILSNKTVETMRAETFEKLQTLPLKYFDTQKHGDIMSRITNDIDNISDGLNQCLSQFFTGILTILGIIGFMFSLNVWIALLVLLITPLSVFVAKFVVIRSSRLFKKQQEKVGEINGFAEEIISGLKTVKAYGLEEDTIRQFAAANEDLYTVGQKAQFSSSQINPSTRLVNHIAYISVGIAGGIAACAGGFSVGKIASFLTYATQFAKPINDIAGVTTQIQNALASAERIAEILAEDSEAFEPETMPELPERVNGAVAFENVSFSYLPERPLIRNMELSVRPNQIVAIVGPTGAGKTTLVNLLMRFYEATGGTIRIDGIEINSVRKKSVRRQFSMVLQDTWLFCGTVRENIAYAREDATEEEIVAAAKAAHAHNFIKRLPNGYDTVLSGSGDLSSGQQQLLTIARAMLLDPPMLILDEATSSVDIRTEQYIQRSFREMMDGRTCFVIAHRLSTIRNADLILVMDKGDIAETGTHEALMEKGGLYKNLVQSGITP
ncbi:MAG: ABC transporter ATP-binding protein [Clostridia bacterium]